MEAWKNISPTALNPEMFDLSNISECKVKKNAALNDMNIMQENGWRIFADLHDQCPLSGKQLEESTWYLYAARGKAV